MAVEGEEITIQSARFVILPWKLLFLQRASIRAEVRGEAVILQKTFQRNQ
jgi:hypothetical protein